MVRVLGNSPERVLLKDLGDTLYYRQKKEYTDQEFSNSKDLQREVGSGRVLVIESNKVRSSVPENAGAEPARTQTTLDLNEIRKIVSEAVSEGRRNSEDLMPLLVSTLRQELSGMKMQGPVGAVGTGVTQQTDVPTYVPEIKMENLKSSINIESKRSEGNLSDSLEALKNLGKKST